VLVEVFYPLSEVFNFGQRGETCRDMKLIQSAPVIPLSLIAIVPFFLKCFAPLPVWYNITTSNINMENNNMTSTNSTSVMPNIREQSELAILFLDILNFTGLMESQPAQTVMGFLRRLTQSQQDLDYVMAV
jgi:hypothetical protein